MSANVPSPNPLRVAWSVLLAMRVRRPRPSGSAAADHSAFQPVLDAVARRGVAGLEEVGADLAAYLKTLAAIDPDRLGGNEALAFWVNAYNAGALQLAREASIQGAASVLELADAFDRSVLTVAGEDLSLNQIEHGKVRRFADPRVHFALVCGSLSCPTLAAEPFRGPPLDDQLDRRARMFLALGGAQADEEAATLSLSRIFLWFGGDFARPHRMPTWLPASKRKVAAAAAEWMDPAAAAWVEQARPKVRFLPYDWSLGCAIG